MKSLIIATLMLLTSTLSWGQEMTLVQAREQAAQVGMLGYEITNQGSDYLKQNQRPNRSVVCQQARAVLKIVKTGSDAAWDVMWVTRDESKFGQLSKQYWQWFNQLHFDLKVNITGESFRPLCKKTGPLTEAEKKTLLYDHYLRIKQAFNGLSNFY